MEELNLITVLLSVTSFLFISLIALLVWIAKKAFAYMKYISDGGKSNEQKLISIQASVDRLLEEQRELKSEVKLVAKMELKMSMVDAALAKIPEMRRDLDAAHSAIRSLKEMR
jgi:hypothetical protein